MDAFIPATSRGELPLRFPAARSPSPFGRLCEDLDRHSLWHSIQALCFLLAISLTFCGCALNRKKINPNLAFPKSPYQHGITHRDEVLAELGPPLKLTVLPGGYAFMYEGLDTQELQLGFSLPIPVVSWFKFVIARADYDHQVMVYLFSHDHILTASGGDETHFDLGNSMAIQPVVTVQMLFDTSAVENEIVDFTQWPAFCLRPLPETLNRQTSLNGGVAGVEQRGTGPSVGQRALEFH
jgi:hypothetical protein